MNTDPRFSGFRTAYLGAAMLAAATLATAASAAVPVNYVRQSAITREYLEDSIPVVDSRLHVAGNLRLGVSSNALFGLPHRPVVHENDNGAYPPVNSISPFFEFPAGSHTLHLYEGGLWIGGIVNGDTLVSTAIDAESREVREFSAFDSIRVSSNLPGSEFYDPSAKSQQQFDCHYYDTLHVDELDPRDGRPHEPLGLEVTQTSHAWLSEPYDDFIIVVYHLKNISNRAIDDLRFGVMSDADVYTSLPSIGAPMNPYSDDVSGYLHDQGIAYAIDNDGDPVAATSWDSTSARSAFGVVPLAIEPAPCCTTFNWWTIRTYDPWPFGGYETWYSPIGDRDIYRTMATDSIGTDQLFIAATQGGTPRDPRFSLDGLAAGTDTRFLLAFGTFDLQPGDSVQVALAYVAGDSVHQDPGNFATNFRASDPQPFYDNLYFGDLIRNAEAARLIYSNGFDLVGGAPPHVSFEPLTDQSVEIHWLAAPFRAVAGYRVYRRITARPSEWEQVGETIGADLLHYTDRDLSLRLTYQYAIAAIGTDGQEWYKSRPAEYKAGLPLVIPSIEVFQDKMDVTIKWSVETPKSTFAPPEYINIYRRAASDSATLRASVPVIGPRSSTMLRTRDNLAAGIVTRFPLRPPATLTGQFLDDEVESGTEYWYSASVTNTLGLEGARSEEIRAIPMAFDRPGIVMVEREQHRSSSGSTLVNEDSVTAFYFSWAYTAGFDSAFTYVGEHPRLVTFDAGEDSTDLLRLISHYQMVVFVDESRRGRDTLPGIATALKDYLHTGGRALLVGCDLPLRFGRGTVQATGATATVEFDEGSFTCSVLGIQRAITENIVLTEPGTGPIQWVRALSVEFVAAHSLERAYPDLNPDTAHASAMLDKLLRVPLPVYGGGLVPAVGALLTFTNADPIYTYVAGFPDTSSMQDLPVAIRSTDPDKRFVLLNFPLSVMEHDPALLALEAAIADLNGISSTASTTRRSATAREILDYLFGPNDHSPKPAYDTNGDAIIDLRDAVQSIDSP